MDDTIRKCPFFPSHMIKKDGSCDKLICNHQQDPKCPVVKIKDVMLPELSTISEDERGKLMEMKLDEVVVANMLKTKPLWDVTEAVYGKTFDHSDRSTWIFYSKVNRIRKKFRLPRVVPS